MFLRKHFSELTLDELYGILRLRAEVFVVEQNCPYQDLDDNDQKAFHIYATQNSEIVACLRVFLKNDGNVTIGRVVSSGKVRGKMRIRGLFGRVPRRRNTAQRDDVSVK